MVQPLRRWALPAASLLALLPAAARAQGEAAPAPAAPAVPELNPANIAFLLTCSALVLLMTPGLALFYGGMVRRKNVLGTLMQSFIAMGIVTVLWMLVGYSLAFAPNPGFFGNFVGGLQWIALNGVSSSEVSDVYATASGVPHQIFMIFQMMFAIITPALISGAFAERKKFGSYLLFISLWSLIVYSPLAHWVWSPDGWLFKMGALDFAGGTVVHISSGVTALVAAIMIGRRRGFPGDEMRPHNLTMTLLGTALLWFGWFGFNAGSALAADGVAVAAFVNTHIATGAAMMAWVWIEWVIGKRPTALGAASGAVAGMVGITPGAGFVTPLGALLIGALVSLVCYFAVIKLKPMLGYDDSLDTFGVHGVGGTVGALLTGVFCTVSVNPAGKDGLLYGNAAQLWPQFAGVAATWLFAGLVGGALLFIVEKVMGLRVKAQDEDAGLDVSQHGEEGYVM